jgi:uncharacterized membrane protein
MSWAVRFRVRQYVKNSLWLMPSIAALVGLVLAELLNWVDSLGDLAILQYSPETATAVVSATIAAVVSLTGFVVTVTVLGVQQATGIFSPRYMRLWYRDGRLKLVLAALVGTLMFSIDIIRRIKPESVPDISVSLSGVGLAVGMLLFLLYLDRFVHRMRPLRWPRCWRARHAVPSMSGRTRPTGPMSPSSRAGTGSPRVRHRSCCGPPGPAPSRRSTWWASPG